MTRLYDFEHGLFKNMSTFSIVEALIENDPYDPYGFYIEGKGIYRLARGHKFILVKPLPKVSCITFLRNCEVYRSTGYNTGTYKMCKFVHSVSVVGYGLGRQGFSYENCEFLHFGRKRAADLLLEVK